MRIKKFLSAKKSFIFLFLLSLFSLFPFSASAQLGGFTKVILAIPYLIITVIFIFFILITGAIATIFGHILDLVISPSFISLSYVNPDKNPVIKGGLNITQNFVNLILVIILVYTALAIALRINEAQAKKTLVRIVIVALLANFAPVFCGLVVDGANIFMNFFLDPIQGGISGWILQSIKTQWETAVHYIFSSATTITDAFGAVAMGAVQIILNIFAAVAFLIYAAIFLFRYVFIWIFVILSPIAFAAWAASPLAAPPETEIGFPITTFVSKLGEEIKGFWDFWLSQFIQWSIIGIPAAFFLYLGVNNFYFLMQTFKAKFEMPGIETPVVGFMDEVFPYFVVLGFLYLGFTIGLKSTSKVTQAIIAGATAMGITATGLSFRVVGKRVARGTAGAYRGTFGKVGALARAGYREARAEGVPPLRAVGASVVAVGRGIADYVRRAPSAIKAGLKATPEQLKKLAIWVGKGTISAASEILIAGGVAAEVLKKEVNCPHCGAKIPRGVKFCPHCGEMVRKKEKGRG